jgi:hypothetical protein
MRERALSNETHLKNRRSHPEAIGSAGAQAPCLDSSRQLTGCAAAAVSRSLRSAHAQELKQRLREDEARLGVVGGSSTVLADLAATLHQLAVVATNSKPARLDEAEGLLQEALRLEMLSVVDPHVCTLPLTLPRTFTCTLLMSWRSQSPMCQRRS